MGASSRKFSAGERLLLLSVCLGLYVTLLDVNILGVARPTIQKALRLSLSQLQWISSVYAITVAVLILPAGKAGDRYGRRSAFLAGTCIFLVGALVSSSAAAAGAWGFEWLFGGRLLQGVGASLLLPCGLAVLSAGFSGAQRARAFGIHGSVTGLGAATAPLLGGFAVQYLGWNWIFLLNVPLIAGALICGAVAIPRDSPARRETPIDALGAFGCGLGVFAMMASLIEANRPHAPWSAVSAGLAFAALVLTLFVQYERKVVDPVVDLALLCRRDLLGAMAVAFCINAGGFALFFFFTLYLQDTLSVRPLDVGLTMMPFNVSVFLAALLAGRMMPRWGARRLMQLAMASLTMGVLLVRARIAPSASLWEFWPGLIAMGVGVGLANAPVGSAATGAVPAANTSSASGLLVFSRQVGNALGVACLALVLGSAFGVATPGTAALSLHAGTASAGTATFVDGVQRVADAAALFAALGVLGAGLVHRFTGLTRAAATSPRTPSTPSSSSIDAPCSKS